MSARAITNPLVDSPPVEVPLRNAPLVRVIAQVRFPSILSVATREFVAPFQEAVRSTYPVLREEETQTFHFAPGGISPAKPQTAWRFSDIDGHWRLSLTSEFLTLETTKYSSRSDFLKRLRGVVQALAEHVQPSQIDRLGLRYIDRITGAAVEDIEALVRAEVVGIHGTIPPHHVVHALSETLFDLPTARVLARWGCIPPGGTVDPSAIEPLQEKSWVLDLDMFSTVTTTFSVDEVLTQAHRYSERIYAIFRWAVTNEFLRRYGGDL